MKDKYTCGYGLAAFVLVLSTTEALLRKGVITHREALEIYTRARAILAVPGADVDPEALKFAERALEVARLAVSAASNENNKPGSN